MIDFQRPIGKVRLLISDVNESAFVLSDAHLTGFLALRGVTDVQDQEAPLSALRRAAADALEAIAISETLVGKVIRSQDLSTDGTKVSAELRALAANLRAQAEQDKA